MTTELAESELMADDKHPTLSVKLHVDVVKTARIVAAHKDETITDLLSNTLRPILARMEREERAKRDKESGKAK